MTPPKNAQMPPSRPEETPDISHSNLLAILGSGPQDAKTKAKPTAESAPKTSPPEPTRDQIRIAHLEHGLSVVLNFTSFLFAIVTQVEVPIEKMLETSEIDPAEIAAANGLIMGENKKIVGLAPTLIGVLRFLQRGKPEVSEDAPPEPAAPAAPVAHCADCALLNGPMTGQALYRQRQNYAEQMKRMGGEAFDVMELPAWEEIPEESRQVCRIRAAEFNLQHNLGQAIEDQPAPVTEKPVETLAVSELPPPA